MTTILFFGRLRDVSGCAQIACELPDAVTTVAALRQWLTDRDPMLGEAIAARGVRVAINRAFSLSDADSTEGAHEIAFMAPLSGG
jgi:molybdopterin converting factor small subunit